MEKYIKEFTWTIALIHLKCKVIVRVNVPTGLPSPVNGRASRLGKSIHLALPALAEPARVTAWKSLDQRECGSVNNVTHRWDRYRSGVECGCG